MPKRVDANQKEVVAYLRQLGASVQMLHEVGRGCPDLLVGFRGINYLFELKNGANAKSRQKLTDDELAWHAKWNGAVYVVSCPKQGAEIMGAR